MKKTKLILTSIFTLGLTLSVLQGPAIANVKAELQHTVSRMKNKSTPLPWEVGEFSKLDYVGASNEQKQKINLLIFNALEGMLMNFAAQQFFGPTASSKANYAGYIAAINKYNSVDKFDGKYSSGMTSVALKEDSDKTKPNPPSSTNFNWLSALLFNNSNTSGTPASTDSIFQKMTVNMRNSKQYQPDPKKPTLTFEYKIVENTPQIVITGTPTRTITVADILGYLLATFMSQAGVYEVLGNKDLTISFAFCGFIHNAFSNPSAHDKFTDPSTKAFFQETVLPLGGFYDQKKYEHEFDLACLFDPSNENIDMRTSSFFFQSLISNLSVPKSNNYFDTTDYKNSNIITNGVFQFLEYFAINAEKSLNSNNDLISSASMFTAVEDLYFKQLADHKLSAIFTENNIKKFNLDTSNPRGDLYIRSIFTNPDMKMNNGDNIIFFGSNDWNFKNIFFMLPFNNGVWSNKIPNESKLKNSYNQALSAFNKAFKPVANISKSDEDLYKDLKVMDSNLNNYWDGIISSSEEWVAKAQKNKWIDDGNYAQISANIVAFKKDRNTLFMDHTKVADLNKSLTALKNDFQILDKKTPNELSTGAIAGIVIGSIAGIILIVIIVYFFARNKKESKNIKGNGKNNLTSQIKIHNK